MLWLLSLKQVVCGADRIPPVDFILSCLLCLLPGVCVKETPRWRIPQEDGRIVWVRFVHRQLSQGQTAALHRYHSLLKFDCSQVARTSPSVLRWKVTPRCFFNIMLRITGSSASVLFVIYRRPSTHTLTHKYMFMTPVRPLHRHFNL